MNKSTKYILFSIQTTSLQVLNPHKDQTKFLKNSTGFHFTYRILALPLNRTVVILHDPGMAQQIFYGNPFLWVHLAAIEKWVEINISNRTQNFIPPENSKFIRTDVNFIITKMLSKTLKWPWKKLFQKGNRGKKTIATNTGLEDKCLTNTNFIGMDIIHEVQSVYCMM